MKDTSGAQLERIDKNLERLKGLDYIPEKHLAFFESVTKAHYKARDSMGEDGIYPSVSKETAQKMLSDGFPLVSFGRMEVNAEALGAHLKEICSILARNEESGPGPVETFSKSEEYEKLDLKELISKTVSQDADYLKGLSENTGVDENTLKFIAITLARPLFELAADQVKEALSQDLWWKNYCPTCGSEPFMAKIRKGDNMRLLGCSLCGTEWQYDRARCPFCGNEDQKSIKFFFYHDQSPHRLYACDKCKRYIKCVDERKMEFGKKINLPIEDMATLYLDTLAREKGYVSGWGFKGTDGQEVSSE